MAATSPTGWRHASGRHGGWTPTTSTACSSNSSVYHPTEETAQALTLWMETLLPREPVRLGLQAKLSVARHEDAPRLLMALRAYEHECLMLAQTVGTTDSQARSWAALCMHCTRDAVYAQLQTEVMWAARTRQRINEFLERSQ
jgi:hypothetical protein